MSARIAALTLALALSLAACSPHDALEFPELAPVAVAQGYVGSDACLGCHGPFVPATVHATFGEDWQASRHGRSGATAPGETTIVGDRDDNGATDFRDGLDLAGLPAWTAFAAGGFAPRLGFDPAGGEYTVSIGPRTFVVEKLLGTGQRMQAYLTRLGASLYVLPVVYDTAAAEWKPLFVGNWYLFDDANGNGRRDGAETITGLVYATGADTPVSAGRTADAFERACLGCHATGIASVTRNAAGEFVASPVEDGVGCEACHGPGRRHAGTLGGRDLPGRAIVVPADLAASAYEDVCRQCHTRGTSTGLVGGAALDYPWHADGTPFQPGEALAGAFDATPPAHEAVHTLQGNRRHVGQTCQTCHAAHDSTNLFRVRPAIDTPNSGRRDVVFTARSGAPGSGGLMGDATDGAFTDVCEVCHTLTEHFRNDGSTPDPDHNNGAACTDCHLHERGFIIGESTGGVRCDLCHDDLAAAMTTVTARTRHLLDDVAATYPPDAATLRCLSCHVDHDLFAPADRARNLRVAIDAVPAGPGDATNRDFLASGSGGICLSCHADAQAKSYTRPNGSTTTPAIPYAAPVAGQVAAYAGGVHSYTATSTIPASGTDTFLADCSKCHNDDLSPKSSFAVQRGPDRFGLHVSTHDSMLGPLGSAAADPLEEDFCYRCHAAAGDPVGGTAKAAAGRDWYDAASMSARAEDIWAAFGKSSAHPVGAARGRHAPDEGTGPGWNPASNRHVECVDCHNPHAAGAGRAFDTTGTFAQPVSPTSAIPPALRGVWGVDVTAWPAAWNPAASFARVETATEEWQVCLKCHSSYAWGATPPSGRTDPTREFNPDNAAYHAVIGAPHATGAPDSSFVAPWSNTSSMSCSDCHTNDARSGAQGPHGSSAGSLLAGPFDATTGQQGTSDHLCFKCHAFDVYGRDGNAGATATGFSEGTKKNLHTMHMKKKNDAAGRNVTCFDCHAAVPHGFDRRALLVVGSDRAPYNNGSAALSAADVAGWPASSNWKKSSCNNASCH